LSVISIFHGTKSLLREGCRFHAVTRPAPGPTPCAAQLRPGVPDDPAEARAPRPGSRVGQSPERLPGGPVPSTRSRLR